MYFNREKTNSVLPLCVGPDTRHVNGCLKANILLVYRLKSSSILILRDTQTKVFDEKFYHPIIFLCIVRMIQI